MLESAKPGDDAVLPAASALASYAPDDAQWEAVGGKVAQALVSANAIQLGPWIEALRPVRGKLSASLAAIFQDKDRHESELNLATNILTDYASDDPERLAELLMVAGSKEYLSLFPVAARSAEQIVPVFQAELSKRATYSWHDVPLDPSWTQPDASLVSRLEQTQGILAARFAFCQTMPIDEFLTTALALRSLGYRPVSFRPYADGQTLRVAAVWTRDGRNWRIVSSLTADAIRQQDERNKNEKFLPVDVAGYVTIDKDAKPTDHYAALWVEKSGEDDARLYVGISADRETEVHDALFEAKLIPRTQNAMIGPDGCASYCGVWGRPPGAAVTGRTIRNQLEENFEHSQAELSDQLLLDVSVSGACKPQPSQERAQADLQSKGNDAGPGPIRDDPAFPELAGAAHADRRYAAVWSTDASFEAISIYGVDPVAQVSRSRDLITLGYRPVSWSVSRTTPDGTPVSASVWHRPVVKEQVKDRLAKRQARAAVGLMRLGRVEEVWPLLRHSADPRCAVSSSTG